VRGFSLDQISEHDLAVAHVDGRIVPRDVNVHLQGLLLQIGHVEVVDLVFERELGLVVWLQTLAHLRGFCRVVVKVERAERDQGAVRVHCHVPERVDCLHRILEVLSVLDFEVQNILVSPNFRLICNLRELRLRIVDLLIFVAAAGRATSRIHIQLLVDVVDHPLLLIGATGQFL